jgi:hypothetical protein
MREPTSRDAPADHKLFNFVSFSIQLRRWGHIIVVRRAKQGASYQVKVLLFQKLASRNYRVLQ